MKRELGRTEVFSVVILVLDFLTDTAEQLQKRFFPPPWKVGRPDPGRFRTETEIVLLSSGGAIAAILTPWGVLELKSDMSEGDWAQCWDRLRQNFPIEELGRIPGLERFQACEILTLKPKDAPLFARLPQPRPADTEQFLEEWDLLARRVRP